MIKEDNTIIQEFKAKTDNYFRPINGLTQQAIEQFVREYLYAKIMEYNLDISLIDIVISGSRCRGLEVAGSDLDIVVEYKGSEREDVLFDIFHEDDLVFGDIKVDINPITKDKSGTLEEYLPKVEEYLDEKRLNIGIDIDDKR